MESMLLFTELYHYWVIAESAIRIHPRMDLVASRSVLKYTGTDWTHKVKHLYKTQIQIQTHTQTQT